MSRLDILEKKIVMHHTFTVLDKGDLLLKMFNYYAKLNYILFLSVVSARPIIWRFAFYYSLECFIACRCIIWNLSLVNYILIVPTFYFRISFVIVIGILCASETLNPFMKLKLSIPSTIKLSKSISIHLVNLLDLLALIVQDESFWCNVRRHCWMDSLCCNDEGMVFHPRSSKCRAS